MRLSSLGFNSWDPDSILVGDVSWDILKNPGISRFDCSSAKICISFIDFLNK